MWLTILYCFHPLYLKLGVRLRDENKQRITNHKDENSKFKITGKKVVIFNKPHG